MERTRPSHRLALFVLALIGIRFAVPLVLLHPAWEFHRDELLYFAMADHFAPFSMQFPPLIAAVAKLSRAVFGDAVWAARVPAAIGGAALLCVLLWVVRRLGGGWWALLLTAVGTLAAPVFVRASLLMQPVVFDQLWATLAVAALVFAVSEREPRWWLLVGVALGLGGLTKFSAAFYAVCVLGSALALPQLRAQLRTRWPWLAVGLALLLVTPSVTGQVVHEWPFLAQMRTLQAGQLAAISTWTYLTEQPLMLGGATLMVLAGVVAALRGDEASRVPATFAVMLVCLMLALQGKAYYAAPAYPVLLATGAVWLERRVSPGRARVLAIGLPLVAVIGAIALLPMGVPMLHPQAMSRYAVALGVVEAPEAMGGALPLPQDYADMVGWRAQAQSAAAAIDALTDEERGQVLLVGSNYGRAGALAMYRARFTLPYPASVHGDFHAWGTYGRSGVVTVLVDRPGAAEELGKMFRSVLEVRRVQEPRAVAEERDVRIYVARDPLAPIDSLWPRLGPRWD